MTHPPYWNDRNGYRNAMYDYRDWHISGTDNPEAHPKTAAWRAESYGVVITSSNEDGIRRAVDRRCEEYPPNGHGGPVNTHKLLAKHGEFELYERRINGKIYVQRWTEETAFQNSKQGYQSITEALQALENNQIEWSSQWTPA